MHHLLSVAHRAGKLYIMGIFFIYLFFYNDETMHNRWEISIIKEH